jgi:hypothetical protein
MTDLTLERREQPNRTLEMGPLSLAPDVDEDYWSYRVRLTPVQSVLGFPKFGTIGVGFAQEEDWNTNLPFICETDDIVKHIAHNRGDESITRADITAAVSLIQHAICEDQGLDPAETIGSIKPVRAKEKKDAQPDG